MLCKFIYFRSRPCYANRTRQSIPKHNTSIVFVACAKQVYAPLEWIICKIWGHGFQNKVPIYNTSSLEWNGVWGRLTNDAKWFPATREQHLVRLYEICKDWVPAFFKGDYCGLMVSTQRSESMNKLVKSAHVDANTPLHQFAKQMMKLLHSRKMKEAKEALGCMVSEKNDKHMFYAIKNKTVLILYCVICRVKRIQLHCICLK